MRTLPLAVVSRGLALTMLAASAGAVWGCADFSPDVGPLNPAPACPVDDAGAGTYGGAYGSSSAAADAACPSPDAHGATTYPGASPPYGD